MHTTTAPSNSTSSANFDTNYIGLDLHQNNVVVAVCRNQFSKGQLTGKVLKPKKFNTQGKAHIDALFAALEEFCKDKPHLAVVESTYNWYWLANEFEKRGWKLVIGDPSTVSKANLKYADDYTDAAYLAECLRNDSIRTTQIMPEQDRAIRDLSRYRMTVVADRGRLKTIVVNLTTNHVSIRVSADKILKNIDQIAAQIIRDREDADLEVITDEVLTELYDNEDVRFRVRSLLRRIRFLTKEIEELDERLAELTQQNEMGEALRTIKGCGTVLSTIISLEIGDIDRFRTHKDFVSYCRLAPTSKLSNGKSKGKGNAKNGNAYLSWAFTELANMVIRFNKEAKTVFDRYFNRSRLRVKAIRAIAAKLARAAFIMLRNGEVFNVKRCFGC